MRFESKTVVLTGAGNGMGREIALQLLKKGARVAGVDISEKGLQETAEMAGSLKDKFSIHVVNITDHAAVEALPEAVKTAHGPVDILINCAGIIQRFVCVNELTPADIEKVMNVNFFGLVNMTKAFLPLLLGRPEAHIVNFSSMGSYLPVPGQTIYGASKAAVKLFTEGLYTELLDSRVHVTAVFPGAIGTNIAANSGVAVAGGATKESSSIKMLEPVKAAEIIIDGIEKNKFRVLVGTDAKTMDILSRLAPKRAAKLIFNQMKELLNGACNG
jgi:short-subunit dehydrogenase